MLHENLNTAQHHPTSSLIWTNHWKILKNPQNGFFHSEIPDTQLGLTGIGNSRLLGKQHAIEHSSKEDIGVLLVSLRRLFWFCQVPWGWGQVLCPYAKRLRFHIVKKCLCGEFMLYLCHCQLLQYCNMDTQDQSLPGSTFLLCLGGCWRPCALAALLLLEGHCLL